MNKQETKGKTDEIAGWAKQTSGILTGDRSLERAGARQQTLGKWRGRLGSLRRKLAHMLDRAAGALRK